MEIDWGNHTVNDITPLEDRHLFPRYIKIGMVKLYRVKKYTVMFYMPYVFLTELFDLHGDIYYKAVKMTEVSNLLKYGAFYTLRKCDDCD